MVALYKEHFDNAPQVAVTNEGRCYNETGFVPVCQYPPAFEVEGGEFGMIVKNGRVVRRYFSAGK